MLNPYDELPYRSVPIEWTAPERLALASLLHGGPRPPVDAYRALELGCADGSNLLPLAYFRRGRGQFVGIDGARSQIEAAEAGRAALELPNVEFVHADLREAAARISGQFDYIIAHGVFSWVPRDTRDALLALCARRLRPGGLLYLNYNTYPGWHVRGMVREFLLARTAGAAGLRARAELAQVTAARVVASMTVGEHPYAQLMTNEFRFVCEHHLSYVAHEYLADHNQPYWRSEFLDLARRHGLAYVADADFNYVTGRVPAELPARLAAEWLTGPSVEDAVDLLCYRQLHSPVLTRAPWTPAPPTPAEFGRLLVASCLAPCDAGGAGFASFRHPTGYEVEAKSDAMRGALDALHPRWPRGLRVAALFRDVADAMDDLVLLHRNGLVELRCVEPDDFGVPCEPLHRWERQHGGYVTGPRHTTESVAADAEAVTSSPAFGTSSWPRAECAEAHAPCGR